MNIKHFIMQAMKQSQLSGHLFVQSDELCNAVAKLLEREEENVPSVGTTNVVRIADSAIQRQLLGLVLDGSLHEDDGRIYLPKNFIAERETAKLVRAMIGTVAAKGNVDGAIVQAEKACGITLADKQREAVKMAVTNNISIITGGPGTGKTTVIKAIQAVYRKIFGGTVTFAAPTGRAARRLAESVGTDAATLHSTLGLRENSEDASRMIKAELLVVDETSMADMNLAYLLFKNLHPKTKLLLVGDCHQLPSVGAGNVLRDLLNCGAIPSAKLNIVHRQAKTSRINLNAHAILKNRAAGLMYGADFEFVSAKNPAEAAEIVKDIYCEYARISQSQVDGGPSHAIDEVQILSPLRAKGICGANALNKEIQGIINPTSPDKPEVIAGYKQFRINDRVMQTKNGGEISNGDIGRIVQIVNGENGGYKVQIDFGDGRIAMYGVNEMQSIDLAYAITIHKSQGSEYAVVIIPILNEASIMLQRNLVYTAITRAREKVIIVGQRDAFFKAIHRADVAKRNTRLAELIAD